MQRTGKLEHLRDSLVAAQDGIGSIYNRVDEYLQKTEIVQNIIRIVFDGRIKDELEKRFIVAMIVDLLVENIKDSEQMGFVAFHQKDWKIPERPREIETSKKFVKLPAKTGSAVDVKIFLTANFIGKFSRNLKLKLQMSGLSPCPYQKVDTTIVNVPILYECQPLELNVVNRVNYVAGYAESEIPLEVVVENSGDVDGFFSFTNFEDLEMHVKCDEEKFHIARKAKRIINFVVMPMRSGLITKYVNLIALGSNRKFPISIECKSFPPDMVIKPNKIVESDLEVLVKHDSRIFIENRSSTKARFFVKLERGNEAFEVEPLGGILSSKQTVLITLSKYFRDPGDYKDVLAVEIVNSKVIVRAFKVIYEVEITFFVLENSHQVHSQKASDSHRTELQ